MTKHKQNTGIYLGIDIGGTGIKGALITAEGEIIKRNTVPTPVEEGRIGIMREIEQLAAFLIDSADDEVVAIGVGSAGSIHPVTGDVVFATENLPGWTGNPLATTISERFGIPVRADNDVNVAALGEAWIGGGRDYESFLLAALGTGVGGALVSHGKIIHGFNGRSGEIGHMILKPNGLSCNCGQQGCLEQYASGTALNRIAREIDAQWTSYTLMEQYKKQDERASEAINQFLHDLAAGLISAYHVFGPEAIIIGGGLIDTADLWWGKLEQTLKEMTHKPIIIKKAKLGNYAGVIGAAYLAKNS